MGLLKTKTLNNGYDATYWRIINIKSDAKDGADVILGGYKDKDASDAGAQDIDHADFHFSGLTKDIFLEGNPYQEAYGLIKESKLDENGEETNWFADAEDA